MSYEYMKEYECNGVKPDLPDDVLIQIRCDNHPTLKGDWLYSGSDELPNIPMLVGEMLLEDGNNNSVTHFRIVDERYKPKNEQDVVNHPQHYQFFDGVEAIEVIASSMTVEQFRGYCMGNKLKYCLRAGKKGDATEDLQKADKYDELFHKYEHLCRQ